MSTKYRFGESEVAHFITCTVVNWIDVFSREEHKTIVVESLRFCTREKGLIIHAWVVMSNHLHLIISTKAENSLPDIVRDFPVVSGLSTRLSLHWNSYCLVLKKVYRLIYTCFLQIGFKCRRPLLSHKSAIEMGTINA